MHVRQVEYVLVWPFGIRCGLSRLIYITRGRRAMYRFGPHFSWTFGSAHARLFNQMLDNNNNNQGAWASCRLGPRRRCATRDKIVSSGILSSSEGRHHIKRSATIPLLVECVKWRTQQPPPPFPLRLQGILNFDDFEF